MIRENRAYLLTPDCLLATVLRYVSLTASRTVEQSCAVFRFRPWTQERRKKLTLCFRLPANICMLALASPRFALGRETGVNRDDGTNKTRDSHMTSNRFPSKVRTLGEHASSLCVVPCARHPFTVRISRVSRKFDRDSQLWPPLHAAPRGEQRNCLRLPTVTVLDGQCQLPSFEQGDQRGIHNRNSSLPHCA